MSVRKYAGKRGTTWHVVLEMGKDLETGKRRQEVIREDPDDGLPMRTKKRAEEVEREARVKLRRGAVVLPDSTPLSVFFERWLRETADDRGANTHYTYASIVRRRLTPGLGAIPLGHLSNLHVHSFLREIHKQYAPSTVRATRGVLAAALNQAKRWHLIDRNPLDDMRFVNDEEPSRDAWTAEQANLFLDAVADDPWEPLWRLLLDSGMRIGEALALQWSDLDSERGEVRVGRTLTVLDQSGKRGPHEKTKTKSGQRTVSLAPATLASLRRQYARQAERRLGLGEYWIDSNLIFDRHDGRYVRDEVPRDRFKRTVKALGLPDKSTPHWLRHTCATLLAAAGEPLHAIKERLGHADIGITANLYAHASRDADRRLSNALERVLQAARDELVTKSS